MLVPALLFSAGKISVVSVAEGNKRACSPTVRRPYLAVPSRLKISTPFILHLHTGKNLAYQVFPYRTTPDGEVRVRVCLHEPCDTNTAYESVIIIGHATVVEDPAVKTAALDAVVAKYTPQHAGAAYPANMLKMTAVVEITISEITGKYYA